MTHCTGLCCTLYCGELHIVLGCVVHFTVVNYTLYWVCCTLYCGELHIVLGRIVHYTVVNYILYWGVFYAVCTVVNYTPTHCKGSPQDLLSGHQDIPHFPDYLIIFLREYISNHYLVISTLTAGKYKY